jgi:hypothetical protein
LEIGICNFLIWGIPKQAQDFTKILHRGKTAITIVVYDEYRLKSWSMSLAGGGPGQKLTTSLSKELKGG